MKRLISLGYNCEVSFQIEKYFGELDSSLFSWAFLLNDEKFLEALENFDDVFMNGIHFHMPTDDMFYDEKYDITFHGRTHKSVMFDENENLINQQAYDESIVELKSRIQHLKEKMHADLVSDEEKIFLRKIEIIPEADGCVDYAKVIEFINRLYSILEKMVRNQNFKLVIVVEKKYMTEELKKMEHSRLFFRTVDYIAPFNNTKDGADYENWKLIIEEFSKDPPPADTKKRSRFLDFFRKRRS